MAFQFQCPQCANVLQAEDFQVVQLDQRPHIADRVAAQAEVLEVALDGEFGEVLQAALAA